MISLIVAYDENRVIGNKGKVPWHIPEDFKHFKQATMGHAVIMGRKTWESLPKKFRPLPGRLNIIMTRTNSSLIANETVDDKTTIIPASGLQEAVFFADKYGSGEKIWVIGGAEIYKMALDYRVVSEILATEVKGVHEGDAFFPDLKKWVWGRQVIETHDLYSIVSYKKLDAHNTPP